MFNLLKFVYQFSAQNLSKINFKSCSEMSKQKR